MWYLIQSQTLISKRVRIHYHLKTMRLPLLIYQISTRSLDNRILCIKSQLIQLQMGFKKKTPNMAIFRLRSRLLRGIKWLSIWNKLTILEERTALKKLPKLRVHRSKILFLWVCNLHNHLKSFRIYFRLSRTPHKDNLPFSLNKT
jgi:hypothetical protein